MKTIIYIARHSQPFREYLGEYNANEIEQIRNEKNPLSVVGEEKACLMSEIPELKNINVLYSSHYVRAMATAKYIAEANKIKLNVDERFGERKFGVNSMSELPKDFYELQFNNWDYKINNGESLNEVALRMQGALEELLNKYKGQNIMVVSHGTALTAMLKKWCEIIYNKETEKAEIYFNNKLIFDGNWKVPELFKLEFEEDKLIKIENKRLK